MEYECAFGFLCSRCIGKAFVHAVLVVVHQVVEFLRRPHGGISFHGVNLVVTPNIDGRSLTVNKLLEENCKWIRN